MPTDRPTTTVASPSAGGSTSTVHDVPVHVIELILLRLDSSACKRWRRVAADAGFQARFRRLRLVLGHYVYCRRHSDPVFVPSSPTPSIIHSRRQPSFSLDFVPRTDGSWRIADGRCGLLLLRKKRGTARCRRFNPDLVVCEPRTRRHVAISVLPDMLGGRPDLGLFLLEDGGGRSIGLYNFRVMAVLLTGRGLPAACVYSGRDGTWHDVKCVREGSIDVPGTVRSFSFAGRANGRLYWAVVGDGGGAHGTALVLDEANAAFSQVAPPESIQTTVHEGSSCLRVVGGEDGALRAVHLVDDNDDLIRVYARRFHGDDQWVLENLVQFPEDTTAVGVVERAIIVAAHEAYVLAAPRHSRWLFSVDLVTMAVERVRKRDVYNEWEAYPYELPWPPILKA